MADTPPAAEWGQLPTPVSMYETVLYYRTGEDEAMKRFYNVTLGLQPVPDSDVAFRLGTQMLLLFNADKSEVQDSPPAHGSTGRTHVCFGVPDGSLDSWKQYLQDAGVKVLEEIAWQTPSPGRVILFRGPSRECAGVDGWRRLEGIGCSYRSEITSQLVAEAGAPLFQDEEAVHGSGGSTCPKVG